MNAKHAAHARMLIGIAGLTAAIGLVGCDDAREPTQTRAADAPASTTGADVRREVGEAADAVGEFTAEQRDAFVAAAQKQYDNLSEELARLGAEAEAKGDAAKAKFAGMRESLEREVRVAKERLDAAKNASAEAWQEVKNGFTAAADDAKAALARARVELFGPPAPTTTPH